MAARDGELEEVEEDAGRFLGLFSWDSTEVLAAARLPPPELSPSPLLSLESLAGETGPGVSGSAPAERLLLSPACLELHDSAAAAVEPAFARAGCSASLRLAPGVFSAAAAASEPFPPDSFSCRAAAAAPEVRSSTASPMRSSVGEEEEWGSREKREGELERSCSLAESGQEGLAPLLSLRARGLAMEERADRGCLCMPRIMDRVESPGGPTKHKTRE
jgi:hypothetical protein